MIVIKFQIKHEIKGRLRVHLTEKLSENDMYTLYCYLSGNPLVKSCKVYTATYDVVINFEGNRRKILNLLFYLDLHTLNIPEEIVQSVAVTQNINTEYKNKMIKKIIYRNINRFILPTGIRYIILCGKAVKYVGKALKSLSQKKMEVSVLDATAIAVSVLRKDFKTAGSVMFLLEIGEILEDWTHKKSVSDLANSMSLNIGKVWKKCNGQLVQVGTAQISENDEIVVSMGNMIPFDGVVSSGEAMVNQSSLTGESVAVHKKEESYVYAGTVVEEGEITVCVRKTQGKTRYEKIVSMIEESEKLKSAVESKAEHLADRLVPYTFLGTALVWLLTRNVTKALSVLMVDFSCALKLAMPVTVLSAIREANTYHITVKGGKFIEKLASANTIVFDKTGTLTKANPTVHSVISFCDKSPDELLKIAACLEEHFPHSIASAVVRHAKEKGIVHDEMHTKVEYVVAHGISSTIDGKRVSIGSYHFLFEDEGVYVPLGYEDKFIHISQEYSRLYMALDNRLVAVICIEDPLREEAEEVIRQLKESGFENIVMMTGDSKHTAKAIAEKLHIDNFYSEVLPEDKANFIMREKEKGNTVVMIGDGINDSPALSVADVGIAIQSGAEIAKEVADITVAENNLNGIVTLRKLSRAMMKRINHNYRNILAVNGGLIALGVSGIAQPTLTATLHNISTLTIGLNSMKNLL